MRKLKTLISLARSGKWREIALTCTSKLIKVEHFELGALSLSQESVTSHTATKLLEKLSHKIASQSDMKALFETWPDSQEEKKRHQQILKLYPEIEVQLFTKKDATHVVHFHYFIKPTPSTPLPKELVPTQVWQLAHNRNAIIRLRVYTFEKFRREGLAKAATSLIQGYYSKQNFNEIIAWRGYCNQSSLKMAAELGFKPIGKLSKYSRPAQKGMLGLIRIN